MTLRIIRQPGPPAPERVFMVRAGAVPIDATLPAGMRLIDALAALLQRGVESACLTLSEGGFGPFAYVIPSLPPDPSHAAYYSDTRRPPGTSALEAASVTLGFRDGRPFFHCHALWTEADGTRGCGHVLPDDTVIAVPIRVSGVGLVGARFEVHPDAETGFSLFTPRGLGHDAAVGRPPGLALRLAPNQDLVETLERVGHEAGFTRAAVQGGVASINGARFADAPPIEGYATELLVRRGTIRCGVGTPTELDIAVVDLHGSIGTGRLVAGDNPVLMTFEGALVEE